MGGGVIFHIHKQFYLGVIMLFQNYTYITAFAATFGWIDTSEYYAAPELEGSGRLF